MTELLERVEQNLLNRKLLKPGQAMLVAVSGGLDSMVLLHVFHRLASRHRWKLTVAHFNHHLRGRSSDADEKLVRRIAARLKVPAVFGHAEVKAFAKKSKLSLEMAARKLRHEFLARVARERKIRVVALAHHADDQVELFFLRLLRGAGGEGLAGMKWCSPSPADSNIELIRPLLAATKEDLLQYAHENQIRFREDATNLSVDFLRNRIRHELLPLLCKKYQPALKRTVLRLMEITGAEAEVIGEAARQWLEVDGRSRGNEAQIKSGKRKAEGGKSKNPHVVSYSFARLSVAVQRRVLQRQLMELGVPLDFELIEQLRESAGRPASIGPGLAVVRDSTGRVALREDEAVGFNRREAALKLPGGAGQKRFAGVRVDWRIEAGVHGIRPRPEKEHEVFDADQVGKQIVLRHWQPGDRFQPIGMKTAVKLQDLFTNRKIPRDRRRELVLAAAENGEIFWVEQLRIGERFKLTPRTRRRLIWRWHRASGGRSPMIARFWACFGAEKSFTPKM